MSDIIKRSDYAPALPSDATDNPFLAYANSVLQRNIVGQLLKFAKGDWFAGEHNEQVEPGTEYIANVNEVLIGWIRWQDNKPTDHIMGKVLEGYKPLARGDLGDLDKGEWEIDDKTGKERDPWQESAYMLLKGTSDGELYTFAASSRGARDSVARLLRAYGLVMSQRPDDFPVVAISGDSYEHKDRSRGRIKYPVFTIVDWAPKTSFDPDLGENAAGEPDEPAPVQEPPAPEPAPVVPPKPSQPVTPPAPRAAARTGRRI